MYRIVRMKAFWFWLSIAILLILIVAQYVWKSESELYFNGIEIEKILTPTKLELNVVDGDTVRYKGRLARIVGMDAPEIWGAKCDAERVAGYVASNKLLTQLRKGPVRLEWEKGSDKYGRLLVRIYINDRDISEIATSGGWARKYDGLSRRNGWC